MCIVLSKSFLFQCNYYSFSQLWPQFWDLCHSYSSRVLSATSHIDWTAHTIELEPLTFAIVVHSKRKEERFKHYQLKTCPAWIAEVLVWCIGAWVESDPWSHLSSGAKVSHNTSLQALCTLESL